MVIGLLLEDDVNFVAKSSNNDMCTLRGPTFRLNDFEVDTSRILIGKSQVPMDLGQIFSTFPFL